MTPLRDQLARFIEGEGHRIELAILDDGRTAELLFRTRGYVVCVAVKEDDPAWFSIATAYEIPPWARERAQNATILHDVAKDRNGIRLTLAPNGKNFVVLFEYAGGTLEAFQGEFWPSVARVRDAGVAALERILDRSETRAAANKFITSLTRGN